MIQELRYERKFMTSLGYRDMEHLIYHHPAMFRKIFRPRRINNFYLDDTQHTNYFENVDGAAQRKKIRIRWYGDLFGRAHNPVLEIKIKKGHLGKKLSYPLVDFNVRKGFSLSDVQDVLAASQLPDVLRTELALQELHLLNSYLRMYALSADGRFRVTLDWDLCYYALSQHKNNFFQRFTDFAHTIVELKYDAPDDHFAHQITRRFPFRMTRSSKYVMGLDYVSMA